MSVAIQIEGLSKIYTRTGEDSAYATLRDTLSNVLRKGKRSQPFAALKDINLTIEEGSRAGIIGRNGAGKSTLLKIISQITPPTKGTVVLEGRVASLLEVGTGFHPELTGKENIYLNGSILGLKRAEINAKLRGIIDFSGVGDFINTPLKNYSSGMQLRLAFSVAAHLEAEILLIDEVLAVGDLEFQRKCMGKMEELSAKGGRTVLFVSHNLEAVTKFCKRSILLDRGQVLMDGKTGEVIERYVSQSTADASAAAWSLADAPGNDELRLLEAWVHDGSGKRKPNFFITEPIGVTLRYTVLKEGLQFTHGINVFNEQGLNLFDSHDNRVHSVNGRREKGTHEATVWIPPNLLSDGRYSLGLALFSQQPFTIYVHQLHALAFTVMDELSAASARGHYAGPYGGLVRPKLEWESQKISSS